MYDQVTNGLVCGVPLALMENEIQVIVVMTRR